jgi:hypothetical protein
MDRAPTERIEEELVDRRDDVARELADGLVVLIPALTLTKATPEFLVVVEGRHVGTRCVRYPR